MNYRKSSTKSFTIVSMFSEKREDLWTINKSWLIDESLVKKPD